MYYIRPGQPSLIALSYQTAGRPCLLTSSHYSIAASTLAWNTLSLTISSLTLNIGRDLGEHIWINSQYSLPWLCWPGGRRKLQVCTNPIPIVLSVNSCCPCYTPSLIVSWKADNIWVEGAEAIFPIKYFDKPGQAWKHFGIWVVGCLRLVVYLVEIVE